MASRRLKKSYIDHEKFYALLNARDLTASEVAGRLGFGPSYFSNIKKIDNGRMVIIVPTRTCRLMDELLGIHYSDIEYVKPEPVVEKTIENEPISEDIPKIDPTPVEVKLAIDYDKLADKVYERFAEHSDDVQYTLYSAIYGAINKSLNN